jgi:hypothetical protein
MVNVSILSLVSTSLVLTSTQENTMLSIEDGHFAVSITVIVPTGNGFHPSTQGKSMKRFHAFITAATGLILNIVHILTQACTFCIFAHQTPISSFTTAICHHSQILYS